MPLIHGLTAVVLPWNWAYKIAAQKGGKIAGDARRQLEIDSNEKVINKSNYLTEPEDKKLLKK